MMWYWGGGLHWWAALLMALGMVAFWGFVIWAVWYLFAAVARDPRRGRPAGPKQILDERLARGEIDPEEYRRLRDLMRPDEMPVGNGREPVGAGSRR